jgi:hypothetical protein
VNVTASLNDATVTSALLTIYSHIPCEDFFEPARARVVPTSHVSMSIHRVGSVRWRHASALLPFHQAGDIHHVFDRWILSQVLLPSFADICFQLFRFGCSLGGTKKIGVSGHRVEDLRMLGSKQSAVHIKGLLKT